MSFKEIYELLEASGFVDTESNAGNRVVFEKILEPEMRSISIDWYNGGGRTEPNWAVYFMQSTKYPNEPWDDFVIASQIRDEEMPKIIESLNFLIQPRQPIFK